MKFRSSEMQFPVFKASKRMLFIIIFTDQWTQCLKKVIFKVHYWISSISPSSERIEGCGFCVFMYSDVGTMPMWKSGDLNMWINFNKLDEREAFIDSLRVHWVDNINRLIS